MDFSGVIATPTHSSSTAFSVVSTFNLYPLQASTAHGTVTWGEIIYVMFTI